ncbi:GNAT family N-acetyltransferase [Blastococcus brunescens]|uniref:GNAT family N-acetyltransferase n=1 Tax=Blastococcus brunescens TaxID=1564165 RepID=A0ABZ1B6U7_9ACTN|nr:GNAT family N-acetyltransferase [Blastococcus sp. BMG 8361]WRL66532.1 GNAT family N-acetyltransferase [Blastococcus sp. BMG 8361]
MGHRPRTSVRGHSGGRLPCRVASGGERLASDWWRVEDGDRVVAYGWLDDVWGDAEILLAVDQSARGTGAGAFTLARLEEEAAARGLNYVLNVVRDTHPDRVAVTEWFLAHGFTGTDDGRLRKRVGDRKRDIGQRNAGRPGTGTFEPDEAHRAAYDAERERASARPRGSPSSRAVLISAPEPRRAAATWTRSTTVSDVVLRTTPRPAVPGSHGAPVPAARQATPRSR